jgi:hypothetical protein
VSWVERFKRLAPVVKLAFEAVKFDPAAMVNPEISGKEYQHGTLSGYEVKEYLLEKHGHKCVYCDSIDRILNVEHMISKARGGSNRVSNLTLSCVDCNEKKDKQSVYEFLAHDPERAKRIMADAQKSLAPAAAMNATRNAMLKALRAIGMPVEVGTGAQTKYNRHRLGLPKEHSVDAACVGEVDTLTHATIPPLHIKCMGRGTHKRTRFTAQGFPRGYLSPKKVHHGFRTGDIVRAVVPSGKKKGVHFGRVAVRATGNFNIQTSRGVVQGISYRHCSKIQSADGYAYNLTKTHKPKPRGFLPVLKGGVSATSL